MKKSLFPIILSVFLGFTGLNAQNCEFTVRLFDQLGDSWDGAELVFKYNGTSNTITMNTFEQEETQIIRFPEKAEVTLEFVSGDFDGEVRYELYDNLGALIFSDGPSPRIGEVFEFKACGCQITTPEVFYYDHREIWLTWNTINTSNQRQVIEYGEKGFTLGDGQVLTTTDSIIMIEGLDPYTEYDIYITSICFPDMDSTALDPLHLRTRRAVDGGISNIEPLSSGCDLEPVEFGFNIINYGGRPLTLVPVFYSVNDRLQAVTMPQDGLYTGLLGPDSSDYFFFDNKYEFPQPGDYKISVWTEIENDTTAFNDSASFTITNSPIITEYPYFESFEDWSGGWYPDTIIQEHSMWKRAGVLQGTESYDGSTVWRAREDVNKDNYIIASLISPCFDFSQLSGDPIVKMALNSDDFNKGDHVLAFEYTKDGGDSWESVSAESTAQNWYSRQGGIVWDAPMAPFEWVLAENIIKGLAGESNIQFRIRYYRTGNGGLDVSTGWQMDAFEIIPRSARDLAVQIIHEDLPVTCKEDQLNFDVRVRNLGLETSSSFSIFIAQDNGMELEFPYSFDLLPNRDTLLNFSLPGLSSNTSEIAVRLEFEGDQVIENNDDLARLEVYPLLSVPFNLEFEIGNFPQWDLDSSENIFFNIDQFFVESKDLAPGERWQIVSPTFGPFEAENDLQLEVNWTDENLEYVALGDQDSLCVFLSTDCFESVQLVGVFTMDNYDPTVDGSILAIDLSDFEGMTGTFILSFKNNGSTNIIASINQFNIRSCHQIGLSSQIVYNTHPDSTNSSIRVMGENGNSPYSYSWSNGINGPVNEGLSDDTYMVTLTDAYGCEVIQSFEVRTCPENLQISFDVQEDEGGLFNNGSVQITSIEGDIEDYTIEWSNGYYNVDRIENLGRERYRLKITNAFGCEYFYVFDFTVTSNEEFVVPGESLENIVCYPNPSSGALYIDLSKWERDQDIQLSLFDGIGRAYWTLQDQDIDSKIIKVNSVKEGMNFLVFRTNKGSKVFKIMGTK